MVTTRTIHRRRLTAGVAGRHSAAPSSRRRRRTRLDLALAQSTAARRLRLSAFARAYAVAAAVLALAVAYLFVGAQLTQTSYQLSRLQQQQADLQASQDQLRYQAAALHTPARVEQAAGQAGLQRTAPAGYQPYQPVAIDLGAPIGADRPEDSPLWQRAVAGIVGGTTKEALASDR